MYNASDMRQIATEAKVKQTIMKKCAAQQFFAKIYPEIEEAATQGEFSISISIPREYGFAVKEIFKIFSGFGYGWKILKQNCFTMVVKIEWQEVAAIAAISFYNRLFRRRTSK